MLASQPVPGDMAVTFGGQPSSHLCLSSYTGNSPFQVPKDAQAYLILSLLRAGLQKWFQWKVAGSFTSWRTNHKQDMEMGKKIQLVLTSETSTYSVKMKLLFGVFVT